MTWKNALRRWYHRWHQRTLEGASSALGKRKAWGFTVEALEALHGSIERFLPDQLGAQALRAVRAPLHTDTIDALVNDLHEAFRTMEPDVSGNRGYVNERLVYVTFEPRTAHTYLATVHRLALSPREALATFHAAALANAKILDELKSDEEEATHDFYFTHRYGSLWNESLTVYRMFAELAGFRLPPFA